MSDLARRYAQALYGLTDDEEALRRTAGALMENTALVVRPPLPRRPGGGKGADPGPASRFGGL